MSLDPHVVVCVSSRPLISDLPSFDHPLLSSLPLSCPFVILWGYIVVVVSCYFLLLCPAKVSFFMCQTERLLCFVRCFSCCLCDFLQRVNSLYSSHCISKMLKRHTHRFQETQWVLNPILVSNVSLTLVVSLLSLENWLVLSCKMTSFLPLLFSLLFSLFSRHWKEKKTTLTLFPQGIFSRQRHGILMRIPILHLILDSLLSSLFPQEIEIHTWIDCSLQKRGKKNKTDAVTQ